MPEDFELEICPLTENLIPDVKRIEIESGLSPWKEEDYRAELLRKDSVTLAAKRNNNTIGFLIARLIMQEDLAAQFSVTETGTPSNPSNPKALNEAEIYNIAVEINQREKGIGQALLDEFLSIAKDLDISNIWLEVRAANYAAINFYKKNGFVETQIRRDFYRFPTEDALVMKLEVGVQDEL